jgi:hypothetical protein
LITDILGPVTAIAAGTVLYASGSSEAERLTRRAWTRLVIWGAAGLSLLPGCRAGDSRAKLGRHEPGGLPAGKPLADDGLLRKWAGLGRIWRELSRHSQKPWGAGLSDGEAFDKLKPEMQEALDALPAWPELRTAFEERWSHVYHSYYSGVSCYEMVSPHPPYDASESVEEQVKQLEQLVAEGKLTTEAAQKAADVLALDVEVLLQSRDAPVDWEEQQELWEEIDERWQAGEITPSPGSDLAGKRLAELTVDDLGLLAGSPEENEGATVQANTAGAPEENTKP